MFKRFVSYYKPHMGLFTLDMICAVIVAACNLYYPTLAKKIINEYSLEELTRILRDYGEEKFAYKIASDILT